MHARIFIVVGSILAILVVLGAVLFSVSRPHEPASPAFEKGRVYRVGVLSGLNFFAPTTDGFKEGMAALGYVEGKNIRYDIQQTDFDMAAYRRIVQKFVADKVDLIFVFPTEAIQEAKAGTQGTNIPLVFAHAFTEDTNLVASVSEPGGNITGVRWPGPDMALQRLDIMRQLVPSMKKVWVPYQKDYPIVASQLRVLYPACVAAGITLKEIPATGPEDLAMVLAAEEKVSGAPDAILIIPEPLLATPNVYAVVGAFAAKYNIPVGGTFLVANGHETVFGAIPQSIPQGKQAALLADKIFRGFAAGSIPVVSAENYLEINYRAAQKLGLTVPEYLLSQADNILR